MIRPYFLSFSQAFSTNILSFKYRHRDEITKREWAHALDMYTNLVIVTS